ncbi:MAG: inositol monophosphatase family protein [Polyangiales bacterium]
MRRKRRTKAKAIFESGLQIDDKINRSPVTNADREVEAMLKAFVHQRYPSASFYGEETGATHSDEKDALRFIVVPSTEHARSCAESIRQSVLVSVGFHGTPVAAVAYMPAQSSYGQSRKRGVRQRCALAALASTPLRLVDRSRRVAAVHRQRPRHHLARTLRQATARARLADFEGYKQVLLGRAEAMVDPGIKPYDVSPAAVLVREAGGRFTSMNGEETIYGPGAIASNGLVHESLLRVVAQTSR